MKLFKESGEWGEYLAFQPLALGQSRNCGAEGWEALATRGQEKSED